MLQLWSMPQLHQHKPNAVFQNGGVPPHSQNKLTTFVNRQFLPE
jgi:hypothetical protein